MSANEIWTGNMEKTNCYVYDCTNAIRYYGVKSLIMYLLILLLFLGITFFLLKLATASLKGGEKNAKIK